MKKIKYSSRIRISNKALYLMIIVADIIHIEACGNNVMIYMRNNDSYTDSKRIGKFLEQFNPKQFHKIHRSHAVNISEVNGFEKGRSGNVIMNNGKKISISTREKSLFKKRMAQKQHV